MRWLITYQLLLDWGKNIFMNTFVVLAWNALRIVPLKWRKSKPNSLSVDSKYHIGVVHHIRYQIKQGVVYKNLYVAKQGTV